MIEQSAASLLSESLPDTPAPIYQRVKQAIIAQITAGQWQENDRVPSESELVKALGASRMTINRALRELTSEGYLFRMQGVGTFVAKQKGATPMLEVHNIAEEIEQRGHQHSSTLVNLTRVKADPEQAALFSIKTGDELFYSYIIHYENGTPVQLEERWVNPAVAPDYLHQDYQTQTPYTYLMNIAPLTSGEHIVEAVMADLRQRNYLEIDEYEPCLLVRRQTWSNQQMVTYARLLYPGSRYKLLGNF